MKRPLIAFLALCAGAAAAPLEVHAQGAAETTAAPADPDLPQPFDTTALRTKLQNRPFNRVVDFNETYLLTGIAHVDGKPMATLMHRETKKRYVVSDIPNDQGWRLTSITGESELKTAQIKLQVGGEEVTIRYDKTASTPVPPQSSRGFSRFGPPSGPRPDIHSLTDADVVRKDEDGKDYVRGSAYLTDAQYERYRSSLSREGHDKFRQVLRDNREKMFQYSADQRADFSRRVFEKIEAEEGGRSGGPGR